MESKSTYYYIYLFKLKFVIKTNKKKKIRYDYLMATDLAARGLDIKELKAVINFEIP